MSIKNDRITHSSESPEDKKTKELISDRLKRWTGAGIEEYPSSGHELDVFAVTPEGVSIYIEIIWTATDRNFFRDMNMIQQSDAEVKLVVVNPKILDKGKYIREFSKVAISQRRIGFAMHGKLFNGTKLIKDSNYLDVEFKETLLGLIGQVQLQGKAAPIYAEFTPPQPPSADKIQERLLSNLFLAKEYPSTVFSARTYIRRDADVFGKLVWRRGWDSNPCGPRRATGLLGSCAQGLRLNPLGHPGS